MPVNPVFNIICICVKKILFPIKEFFSNVEQKTVICIHNEICGSMLKVQVDSYKKNIKINKVRHLFINIFFLYASLSRAIIVNPHIVLLDAESL